MSWIQSYFCADSALQQRFAQKNRSYAKVYEIQNFNNLMDCFNWYFWKCSLTLAINKFLKRS